MGLQTNIVKRGGSANYYARVAVPTDLQPVLQKRELWKSLGTTDQREARRRASAIVAVWHADFADLRRKRSPTPDDLQAIAWKHYQLELERDRSERARAPKAANVDTARAAYLTDIQSGKADPADIGRLVDFLIVHDASALAKEFRQRRESELRKHLATGETAPIQDVADDVIAREGLLITKGTSDYHDLCQMLQRAELEALTRAAERDAGQWSGRPADEAIAPPTPSATVPMAAPGETVMELYDRFAREKAGNATPDTWSQNRKIVGLFAEFVGVGAHISAVNRKAVRDFKNALAKWPIKATESTEFKGRLFPEIVAANADLHRPAISQKSVNKYLAALGSFGRWLQDNEYISDDITRGMYLAVDKGKRTRLPFTSDQLSALFGSPLYTGFQADGKEHLPGNQRADDWRHWIPLILLFTGARLGEIAQLLPGDVRQLHGQWVFHITEEGDEAKNVKTEGSMRVVPVHPELIRLGFLDYHAAKIASQSKRLFPELTQDARGFWSGTPSDFLNQYLKRVGVKQDKTVNVHSFRHGFADALRRAGYRDEEFGLLLGHTKASTTGRYGILPEGILGQRVAMVEAVNYPGLDLSTLHRH